MDRSERMSGKQRKIVDRAVMDRVKLVRESDDDVSDAFLSANAVLNSVESRR